MKCGWTCGWRHGAMIVLAAVVAGFVHSNISRDGDTITALAAVWAKADSAPAGTDTGTGLNVTNPPLPDDHGAPVSPPTNTSIDFTALSADITLAQAKQIYDEGRADFIDARPKDKYEAGHIEGAMSIPPDVLREGLAPQMKAGYLTPGDRPVVIYCEGGECDDSIRVRTHMTPMGYKCFILVVGFPAWEAAGYQIATGPDPLAEDGGGGGG